MNLKDCSDLSEPGFLQVPQHSVCVDSKMWFPPHTMHAHEHDKQFFFFWSGILSVVIMLHATSRLGPITGAVTVPA